MNGPAPERTTAGLEYLQRVVSGEIGGVPIGETLGFRLVEVEKGRVALLGNPDLRSYNLVGTVHGGWGAAILDYADLTAAIPLPAGAAPDEEPMLAVGNARILRSGLEIFAYVSWDEPGANGGTRTFRGCVRLAREDQFPKTAPPPLKPRETEVASAR